MTTGTSPAGLQLSEEEAFALLAMCLTSPHALDSVSEQALRKLAEYAISRSTNKDGRTIDLTQYTKATGA
jgi:hypothetical protein